MQPRRVLIVCPPNSLRRGLLRGISDWLRETRTEWDFPVQPWTAGIARAFGDWDHCDGMLISSLNDRLIAEAREHDIPVVCVSAARDESGISRVLADSREIGRMAARHFLGRGFGHFLCVGLCPSWFSEERLAGFRETVSLKGHPCEAAMLDMASGDAWGESIRRLADTLVAAPKPLAVLGCSDAQAAKVIDLCGRRGIRVPDDVAVVGIDNDDNMCEFSRPRISSIDPNFVRVGYLAADLLEKLMAGEPPSAEPILVPPRQLVVRTSSDMLAIEDSVVVEAMRAIRRWASKPIRVDDVVEAIPVSRRPLEKRFRRATGRTIAEEIMLAHVGRAQELLTISDLTMLEVALASGFRSQQHLSQVFRKRLGCSPNEYRRQHRGLSS